MAWWDNVPTSRLLVLTSIELVTTKSLSFQLDDHTHINNTRSEKKTRNPLGRCWRRNFGSICLASIVELKVCLHAVLSVGFPAWNNAVEQVRIRLHSDFSSFALVFLSPRKALN